MNHVRTINKNSGDYKTLLDRNPIIARLEPRKLSGGMNFIDLPEPPGRDLHGELSGFLRQCGYPSETCFELLPSERKNGTWVLEIFPDPIDGREGYGQDPDDCESVSGEAFPFREKRFVRLLELYLSCLEAVRGSRDLILEDWQDLMTPGTVKSVEKMLEESKSPINVYLES